MKKYKKCKGITPQTKGWGCKREVLAKNRVHGLGKMCCYPDWLLNSEAGKLKMQKAALKATKPRRELEEAQKQQNKRKRLSSVIKQTQIVFNRYIRLRDKGKPCISSGAPWKPDFEAGHLFPVSTYSALRFDEDNCHIQSIEDNRFKGGNFEDYLIKVRYRVGEERFNALQARAEASKRTIHKWTVEEVEQIRKTYLEKIKKLEI